ncbi:hypothetical protein Tco_0374414 [Tanacetum coccineum]
MDLYILLGVLGLLSWNKLDYCLLFMHRVLRRVCMCQGTNHVPYEDMNLERLQVELHNFGDKAREDEDENKKLEALLDLKTKNVTGTEVRNDLDIYSGLNSLQHQSVPSFVSSPHEGIVHLSRAYGPNNSSPTGPISYAKFVTPLNWVAAE